MSSTSKNTKPRSSSRSKRSTTNLANLRLAPLSAKFTDDTPDTSSTDGQADAFRTLGASHRSAPTSPRILSRNSSRRYPGGLSRRSSLYENDDAYPYATPTGTVKDETRPNGAKLQLSTGQVPKAKSEAALGVPPHQQRLAGPGVQVKRKYNAYYTPRSRASGTNTPRVRVEEDWLTRTGYAASNILQEQKGQSFLSSRNSQLHLGHDPHGLSDDEDGDDDDDEGYEEMAAMSARTMSRSQFADDEMSPVSTRSRYGSRYGSRAASRRTSRRGSMVNFAAGGNGSRTPLASAQAADGRSYFDHHHALPIEPDFIDEEGESSADEGAASRFTSLGGLVDRLLGFNLLSVDEEGRETGTESEAEGRGGGVGRGVEETEDEARQRMSGEQRRRREEKERLRAVQQRRGGEGRDGEGGWQEDAKWLLGRAREAWL